MTFANRLLSIFYAPSDTFEAFMEERDWKDIWIPIVILALVGLVSSYILEDVLADYRIERSEQYLENNDQIPEEVKAEQLEQLYDKLENPSVFGRVLTFFASLLSIPVRVLFLALVALAVGNFILGGQAKFVDMLILSGFVYLINILELVVKIPLILSKWDLEVHTGLGLLNIGESGEFIYHFLAGIDIFAFWRIVLFAIGMGIIYKKSTGTYITAMTLVWLLLVAISAGMGAAFS